MYSSAWHVFKPGKNTTICVHEKDRSWQWGGWVRGRRGDLEDMCRAIPVTRMSEGEYSHDVSGGERQGIIDRRVFYK